MARRKSTGGQQSTEEILQAITSGNDDLTAMVQSAFQNQHSAILQVAQGLQQLTNRMKAADRDVHVSDSAEEPERLSEADDRVVNELQTASLLHQLMNDHELADQLVGESESESVSEDFVSIDSEVAERCECRCGEAEEVDESVGILEDFEPVEVDGLSPEEMRSALIDQERVIANLASILKKRQRRQPLFSDEQLREFEDKLPSDLENLVSESLKALDQQARISELELSLDRARVSRQISQLEETKQRLDARAKTLGVTIADDGQLEHAPTTEKEGSQNRRWLGALGFSR